MSTLLGWWSFRGLFTTGYYVYKNIGALREPERTSPSRMLEDEAAYRAYHEE